MIQRHICPEVDNPDPVRRPKSRRLEGPQLAPQVAALRVLHRQVCPGGPQLRGEVGGREPGRGPWLGKKNGEVLLVFLSFLGQNQLRVAPFAPGKFVELLDRFLAWDGKRKMVWAAGELLMVAMDITRIWILHGVQRLRLMEDIQPER